MRLVLATTNSAKVLALAEYLPAHIRIDALPPSTRSTVRPIGLENGRSFDEIATAKARFWSTHLPGEYVIASDGGLLIPALGDYWNPLQTARFLGPEFTAADRIDAILDCCRHLRGDDRQIGWRESLALVLDGELLKIWSAESPPGLLTDVSAVVPVESGFWVPAIWECPESNGKLLADLDDNERIARHDHWSHLSALLTDWVRTQDE